MKQVWRWLLGEPSEAPPRHASIVPGTGVPDSSAAQLQELEPLAHPGPKAQGDFAPQPPEAELVVRALQSAAASSANLASVAERLVPALDGLPDLVRHQGRATEAILQLTNQARDRDALLAKALSEFEQGAERQTQLLRLIQQQLDLNHVTNTSVAEGLRDASIALGAYAGTSERHTRAIESLLEATRRRTRKADQMERSLQTWMIVTTGLATACLCYSLFLAYRSASPAIDPASDVTMADSTPNAPRTASPADLPPAAGTTSASSATTESTGDDDPGASPSEAGRDKAPNAPANPTSEVIPLP